MRNIVAASSALLCAAMPLVSCSANVPPAVQPSGVKVLSIVASPQSTDTANYPRLTRHGVPCSVLLAFKGEGQGDVKVTITGKGDVLRSEHAIVFGDNPMHVYADVSGIPAEKLVGGVRIRLEGLADSSDEVFFPFQSGIECMADAIK